MHAFFSKKLAILIVLALIAVAVRIPLLNASFWLDEAAQALLSTRPLSEQLVIAADFQPPFFHLIVHFLSLLATQEWWLRLASVIPSVITVLILFHIVKKQTDTTTGYLAAIFLGVNAFHVFFSQELRPYAFAAMWATLSWWWMLKIQTQPARKGWYIGYAVTTAAGLYSSYLYPFHLLGQLIYIFLMPQRRLKYWFLSLGTSGLLYLPWLPYFWEQFTVGSMLRTHTAGWESVVGTPVMKALPLTLAKFFFGMQDLELTWQFLLPTVIITTVIGWITIAIFRQKREALTKHFLLMSCWILIPLLSSWLISFWVPVIQPKRIMLILPGVMAAVAIVARTGLRLPSALTRGLAFLLIGSYLSLQFFALAAYWTQPVLQRENWRQLISDVNSSYSPQETTVVFAFDDPFAPWNWYQTQAYPIITTGTQTLSESNELPTETFAQLNTSRVLVLDYLRDLTDPDRLIDQGLTQAGYVESDVLDYGQIGFVRVWERNP